MKKTILISAATYLIMELFFWAAGWMIWPIIWIGLGYASIKIWEWLEAKMFPHDPTLPVGAKIVALILGPIMGMVSFAIEGWKYVDWPKKIPKFRNPFFFPEKELDKQQ